MIQELGDSLIPVLAISCTFLFLVIWVIAATVDSLYKTASNARLKDKLIERGLSAGEIDKIMKAGMSKSEYDWNSDEEYSSVPPEKKHYHRPAPLTGQPS